MDLSKIKAKLNENQNTFPAIAAVLTFLYEWRYLKKTRTPITSTSWARCLVGAGISYGMTTLMISNLDTIFENQKQPIEKKLSEM
jgi:hypothetical protein